MTSFQSRTPQDLQPQRELDDVDRRLLELLRDNRMTDRALSVALGVAPSTCVARMKAL